MKVSKLMTIAVLVAAIAVPCSVLFAQSDTNERDYGNQTMDQGFGNQTTDQSNDKDLPGVAAGRGPAFSDPQVEPSPWGGRVSPYPPYHQDTNN